MPTFRYDQLTATSYRVIDAHTGEAYGVIRPGGTLAMPGWNYSATGAFPWHGNYPTRDAAARALYAARHAHGFEAGAL
jgi:hypothetical protein